MIVELFGVKVSVVFLLLALALIDGSTSAAGELRTLKIIAYNIHGGVGSDGRKDLERIALVLKSAVPEVVALNEVNRFFLGHHQDEAIAKELGPEWQAVFGKTFAKPLADYGNAILTKLPVVSSESWLLSDFPHQERRGLLRVTVEKQGNVFHFFAVHMGLNAAMRARHSGEILDIMSRFKDGYCVLLGDFNEQRSSSPGTALSQFAGKLKDCSAYYGLGPQSTFPVNRSFRRIDFIWLDERLAALDCYVPRHADARLASDHLPVAARVMVSEDGHNDHVEGSVSGGRYLEDFRGVPPSHEPAGWKVEEGGPNGDFIAGVAVVGREHVWRQSSREVLKFTTGITTRTVGSWEAVARIKTIALGGGSWQMGAGPIKISVHHDRGDVPRAKVWRGGRVAAEVVLTELGLDPYDWNLFRVAEEERGGEGRTGGTIFSAFVNGIRIVEGEMEEADDEQIRSVIFSTAGQAGACEIYVDWVSMGPGDGTSAVGGHRIIELEDRAPVGWLNWW